MLSQTNENMPNKVYQSLKNKILYFEIQPGQSLTEETLAREFDVSRTPIREALRMLAKDQLVEIFRNKGAIVKGISEEDVNDIFDVRIALESWAAGVAAKEISEINLREIENRLALARVKFEDGDYQAADTVGNEIHDIIAFVVDNKWFKHLTDELSNYTVAYKKIAAMQIEQLKRAQDEHESIFHALKTHNSFLAQQLMIEHIANAKQSIINGLKERPYFSE